MLLASSLQQTILLLYYFLPASCLFPAVGRGKGYRVKVAVRNSSGILMLAFLLTSAHQKPLEHALMPSEENQPHKVSSSDNMIMLGSSMNASPRSDLHSNYREERVSFMSDPLMFPGPTEGLGPNDVLCGRNKEAFNHFGNQRFRQAINSALESYKNAQSRREKSSITLSIFESIRSQGGRFLKRHEETGRLTVLTDQQSKEKIAHAVRDVVNKSQARKRAKSSLGEAKSESSSSYVPTGLGQVGVDHQIMEINPRDSLGRPVQQEENPFGGPALQTAEISSGFSKQSVPASNPLQYSSRTAAVASDQGAFHSTYSQQSRVASPFDDLLWAIEFNLGPLTSDDLSHFQQGKMYHHLDDLQEEDDLEPYASF